MGCFGRSVRISDVEDDSSESDSEAEKEEIVLPFQVSQGLNHVFDTFITRQCQADFDRVVKQDDLRFDGDFAHGKPLPQAPNPCLHIEGLGTIGLPLNDTEAKRVFEQANAPHNPGASVKTKNDDGVICDIEGSRVSFRNPVWKPFLNELVRSTCEALAALFSLSVPTCELRKLSLCRVGTPYVCFKLTRIYY